MLNCSTFVVVVLIKAPTPLIATRGFAIRIATHVHGEQVAWPVADLQLDTDLIWLP